MIETISTGKIKNTYDHKYYKYEIKVLDTTYFDELFDIQKYIAKKLNKPEAYILLKEKELIEMLGDKGIIVGVFVNKKLYGSCGVYFPGFNEDNLGLDIDLPREELKKVIHLESSNVHPMYRGNSLQYKMAFLLVNRAKEINGMRYLLNTVHPKNYPSLKTTFRLNMVITKLCLKYKGFWRYIFYQDIKKPVKKKSKEIISVSNIDYDTQINLLDKGYYGFGFEKNENDIKIHFGH
ncbi:MAG: hypothetical protein ACQEQE_06890 [Bacillota bacterium]